MLPALPPGHAGTRVALHRVAVHVLARRRHALSGRIGLRATPGGFGTAAAGPEHEVLRVAGTWLLHERTGEQAATAALDLTAASLADAAAFAGVDLDDAGFSAGDDTPPVGDRDAPLGIDAAAVEALAAWLALGWAALDAATTGAGPDASPTVVQLWPEHLDAGVDLAVGGGRRTNLGASAGDGFHEAPYLYVGPWGDERPGDAGYWNAPFGAVLGYAAVAAAADPAVAAVDFLRAGLARLAPGRTG